MSLGERIYKLRTEKKLSQADLADALDVSRQSISKWETNGSVPELDKLVKLSEVFGVSLDELILDKKQPETIAAQESKVIYVEKTAKNSGKKTAGVVLLCFAALVWMMLALLGDVLAGLVLAAPFVACGLICILTKNNTGLWCAWTVYLFVEIYLRFATGVNWQYVLLPHVYAAGMTIQLIVAWIMMGILAVLTGATALRLRKMGPGTLRGNLIGTISSWGVYLITWFLFALPAYEAQNAVTYSQVYRYVSPITGWVRNMVLVVAVVYSIWLIASLLEKRKKN